MDKVIYTPRLKLTLITEAAKGSREFKWLEEIWSDEKSTWWSIVGRAKTTEDIERVVSRDLPSTTDPQSRYKVVYAIHRLLEPNTNMTTTPNTTATSEFIGLANLKPSGPTGLSLPPHLLPPPTPNTLTLELGYMFLAPSWGKGHATEAMTALFDACARATPAGFWAPYDRVYVRAIVNSENPKSSRVVEKCGMGRLGVFGWRGKEIFLAGRWRTSDDLVIYGKFVVGSED